MRTKKILKGTLTETKLLKHLRSFTKNILVNLNGRINALEQGLQYARLTVREMKQENLKHSQVLEKVDLKIGIMDSKMVEMDIKLSEMDNKIIEMDSKIMEMDNKIRGVDIKLDRFAEKTDRQDLEIMTMKPS